MVAIDPIEQMHAKTFKLVSADTGKNSRTGKVKILRDFTGLERAHVKIGRIAFCNERFAIAGETEGGGQSMRPARKKRKRIRSLDEVA